MRLAEVARLSQHGLCPFKSQGEAAGDAERQESSTKNGIRLVEVSLEANHSLQLRHLLVR
jgi:hypothetical protein